MCMISNGNGVVRLRLFLAVSKGVRAFVTAVVGTVLGFVICSRVGVDLSRIACMSTNGDENQICMKARVQA